MKSKIHEYQLKKIKMMSNNLIYKAAFLATTLFGFAQNVPMNTLTVDGKNYNLQSEKPMTYTEKKGEWSLTSEFTGSNGEKGIMNIRTKGKFLPSGNYPMVNNTKSVAEGSVAYSISINTDNMAFGMLSYKQYTSTEKGTAVVKYEDGIYSFEFVGVEGINIRAQKFLVDANMTFDPNAHKTRKELNKENKDLNMSNAWMNETKYFIAQATRLQTFCQMFKEKKSSEKRDKIEETVEKMMDSNEEIMKILSRSNDGSMKDAEINQYKEMSTKKAEELKKFKKEINGAKITDVMDAFLIGLGQGKKMQE